jgi:hypothetical protein
VIAVATLNLEQLAAAVQGIRDRRRRLVGAAKELWRALMPRNRAGGLPRVLDRRPRGRPPLRVLLDSKLGFPETPIFSFTPHLCRSMLAELAFDEGYGL